MPGGKTAGRGPCVFLSSFLSYLAVVFGCRRGFSPFVRSKGANASADSGRRFTLVEWPECRLLSARRLPGGLRTTVRRPASMYSAAPMPARRRRGTKVGSAIATMILAVIAPRVTLGHTGRDLTANRATVAIFVLINARRSSRVCASWHTDDMMILLGWSGRCWIAAFGLFERLRPDAVDAATRALRPVAMSKHPPLSKKRIGGRRRVHSRHFYLPSSVSSPCCKPMASNASWDIRTISSLAP